MTSHPIAPIVRGEVQQLLDRTPSFHQLDAPTRRALSDSMSRVVEYLAAGPDAPYASQLAGNDLASRLTPPAASSSPAPQGQAPAPTSAPAAGAPAPASGGTTATGRAGEVTRATLNAIDFPSFVGSLIHGTFQAIVDASIQQMQAYAELLKSVSTTVDRFMEDNISDGAARDYLADQHSDFLLRDTSSGSPRLKVKPQKDAGVPSFFKDLGFNSPDEIDDTAMEETAVPAARRRLAEQRQQTLATMVLMGINRVLVDSGEITAKLMFHIDAAESMQMRFDQTKTTTANMAGRAGSNPFSAQALMVNTSSINAQNDINVRADLTGQVKVLFKSESFPLERFADSAAIQLINSNAKVPGAKAPASEPPAPAAAAPPPAPALPAPPAPAPAPPAAKTAGVDEGSAPWGRPLSPVHYDDRWGSAAEAAGAADPWAPEAT
jgi:hypothetical protein